MSKPADEPDFHVATNASRPHLVRFAIGSGTDGYDITPKRAEALADQLLAVAASARE